MAPGLCPSKDGQVISSHRPILERSAYVADGENAHDLDNFKILNVQTKLMKII